MYNVYNLLIFSNDDLVDVNACPTQLVVPCALYFAKYLLCSCDHYKLFVCFARSSSIRVWGVSSLYDTRILKQLPICRLFSSLCIWITFVKSDLKRNNVRTLVTSVMNGVPAFYTNCGGGKIESSGIVRQASRPPPGET